MQKVIKLWTDGSAIQRAGGGFAVMNEEHLPVILGREDPSTNIRMEGMALICAIAYTGKKPAIIHTDSQFWIDVLTKYALVWVKNNWTKKNGDIKNLDLVKLMFELYNNSKAEIVWVKGHSDDAGNDGADIWANKARKGQGVNSAMLFNLQKTSIESVVDSINNLR